MRDYSKVGPQFWIGKTGKKLRAAGPEAQIVGMYLMTSPHANMLGLYYVAMNSIAHETGLGMEGASKGLQSCIEAQFCSYDDEAEMVWVHEMAGYQIAEALVATDKRCQGVQNEYNALPGNAYLEKFYDKYHAAFNMTRSRVADGEMATREQAPSKPLRSQEQEQEHKQEHDQDQKIPPAAAPATPKRSRKSPTFPMPDGFCISDQVRAWAQKSGVQHLDRHFDSFITKVKAKGYVYADWDAALRNAITDDWAKLGTTPQAWASPGGYESVKDRGRREVIEGLTGKRNERSESTIIDLN